MMVALMKNKTQQEFDLEKNQKPHTGPRSIARVLGIFSILSKFEDGVSLTDLSLALNSPKSSLLSLLRPLVADEFLVIENNMYRLGPSIYRLSAHVLGSWTFPRLIRPFMEELAKKTGETVLLSVLNREAEVVTYIEIVPSPNPIRYQIPVGTTRPLYASSSGRLLLAKCEKSWRDAYIRSVTFKTKLATQVNRVWLLEQLENINKEGVARSIDIYAVGLSAVSAPLFDTTGNCAACLTLAGPTERFKNEMNSRKDALLDVVSRASGLPLPA